MRLYVVRHAHAGSRSTWDGTDESRPLTTKGQKQAAAIAETLAASGVGASGQQPHRRCMQSLEPLAPGSA